MPLGQSLPSGHITAGDASEVPADHHFLLPLSFRDS